MPKCDYRGKRCDSKKVQRPQLYEPPHTAITHPNSQSNYEKDKIRYSFSLKESYPAPLEAGEVLGEINIYLEEENLGSVKLTVKEDVVRAPFYEPLRKFFLQIIN